MPPPPDEDGPDGSSIKPVSSLRARFENMSKAIITDVNPSSPHPSPMPAPLSRPISPAPRPDRGRGAASPVPSDRPFGAPLPPNRPKPRDSSLAKSSTALLSPALTGQASSSWLATPTPSSASEGPNLNGTVRLSSRNGPLPPLSPRPTAPPSLLVQPPQSPPKGRAGNLAPSGGDQSSFFLNPEPVTTATTSPSSSPQPRKSPSRPHTPTSLDARMSQRLSPKPPSPPPPRRSAELKRERDQRDQHKEQQPKPAPPPINRSPAPQSNGSPPSHRIIAEKLSPFGTPPSGGLDSFEEDQPPILPARPRSQLPSAERNPNVIPRPRSIVVPHLPEPPPVGEHKLLAARLADRNQIRSSGVGARNALPLQITESDIEDGAARPPLPVRPVSGTVHTPFPQHASASISSRLPPRPPRAGVESSATYGNGNGTSSVSGFDGQMPPPPLGKRVSSNPTTSTQYFPPPPTRTQHGRSMTVDRATAKLSSDVRGLVTTVAVTQGLGDNTNGTSTPWETANRSTDTLAATVSGVKSLEGDQVAVFPDTTIVNRRPPYSKQGPSEISTRFDCRQADVCDQRIVTTGQLTRVWSLMDGELLMSLAHSESVRATCVAFKPGAHVDDEGLRVWIGTVTGELLEADIATQSIVASRPGAHNRHEIVKIYRHCTELWTLCDGGALYVWGPMEDTGVPSLASGQQQSFRVPRGHTFSMVVGDELWHAAGKELRIFLPTVDGTAQFQVFSRAIIQDGAGEIASGTVLLSEPDKVYLGHSDGKVSIYSRTDYTCLGLVSLGTYKVNTLSSAGPYIWAGFNTGYVFVYDVSSSPWIVKKEWAAHDHPVVSLVSDRTSAYRTGQLQVLSLGADNMLRMWDGLLQDDWLEEAMQLRDESYCDFDRIRAHVMTWNAGASTPGSLRYSNEDASFMQNLLHNSDSPDIFVFGFQELVDLEDKKATAKRILKVKKKESSDQDRMSHQYRDWRDFLTRCLDDFMDGQLYQLLQTSHMVGLFTCIFVKADLHDRIRNVATTEVKRGMGGLHGNKGAIAIRFLLDDTSLCFVNCHLAAGQSQKSSRHNDAAAILDSAGLPAERDVNVRIDTYIGGGDGSMILDHELCVLNGDLNYRIDTMSRDTVVAAIKSGNLGKLLDRDQLLVARRRNAAFRLRAFDELPIRFDPTYKYDVGTDNYDTSEKKRSPAWCDRLLFRGGRHKRVCQLDYRRHEVRVSDHRPVTGRFEFTVKHVDAKRRALTWMGCQQDLEDYREQVGYREKMFYLTQIIGYDEATSEGLIRERNKQRRARRSPSRQRE
ncbi:MAG: hypothetical protein SEPTF4163_004574 [Sporothrix epigloea]